MKKIFLKLLIVVIVSFKGLGQTNITLQAVQPTLLYLTSIDEMGTQVIHFNIKLPDYMESLREVDTIICKYSKEKGGNATTLLKIPLRPTVDTSGNYYLSDSYQNNYVIGFLNPNTMGHPRMTGTFSILKNACWVELIFKKKNGRSSLPVSLNYDPQCILTGLNNFNDIKPNKDLFDIYDLNGMLLRENVVQISDVTLKSGIYIISSNFRTSKLIFY